MENNKENLRSKKLLMKKLKVCYADIGNKSIPVGKYDLLQLLSPSSINVDYIALYSRANEYNKTNNTAVSFFEYDYKFIDIWRSIEDGDERKLNKYKERFSNVKYIISPDFSLCGDNYNCFNVANIQKARIISIWLTCECGVNVIPLVTYSNEQSFEYFLDGLEECKVVCFSLEHALQSSIDRALLIEAIKHTVDKLKFLSEILIYSVSNNDNKIREIFSYAIEKNIKLIIPSNLLKQRNIALRHQNGKI